MIFNSIDHISIINLAIIGSGDIRKSFYLSLAFKYSAVFIPKSMGTKLISTLSMK